MSPDVVLGEGRAKVAPTERRAKKIDEERIILAGKVGGQHDVFRTEVRKYISLTGKIKEVRGEETNANSSACILYVR